MAVIVATTLLLLLLLHSTSLTFSTESTSTISSLSDEHYRREFATFIKRHNKQYVNAELSQKLSTFTHNYDSVRAHNARADTDPTIAYRQAVNAMSDLTADEFRAQKLGLNRAAMNATALSKYADTSTPALDESISSVDWRTKGVVTAVKDQGTCGSCWAFSATGCVESAVAIASGRLTSLSEQQLMDCSKGSENKGCLGGLPLTAFEYIIDDGICSERDYSYIAVMYPQCQSQCNRVSHITSIGVINGSDAQTMETDMRARVNIQPISVAVEADQAAFQHYSSGVLSGPCGKSLDHAVLIVGYGTDETTQLDYWLVKNSWSSTWGEDGYLRMQRDVNQCGIAMSPLYVIV